MNPRIQHLLNHPFEVELNDVALLQDQIEIYPYFSSLRTLLLFGLKEFDHETYQSELKKASIYSPSRVALYHYLQKEKQEAVEEIETLEEIELETKAEDYVFESYRKSIAEEKAESEKQTENQIPDEESQTQDVLVEIEEEKEIESKELIFEEVETKTEVFPTSSEMTFSEWLALTSSNSKTKESEKSLTEKDIKFQLIDEFIEKSPKIAPSPKIESQKPLSSQPSQTTEYSDLMTETLAQIYTEQKMFDKAIKAYKILSLKYPDKREFFIQKIEEIENQKNS